MILENPPVAFILSLACLRFLRDRCFPCLTLGSVSWTGSSTFSSFEHPPPRPQQTCFPSLWLAQPLLAPPSLLQISSLPSRIFICPFTFELFPIPNFGSPLFSPSSMTQALQIRIDEMYLHRSHIPCFGILIPSRTESCSPVVDKFS